MNNSDFQRLLLTNDKELISELTKPKAKKSAKNRPPPKGKGKGGGKGGKDGERDKKQKGAKAQAADAAAQGSEEAKAQSQYRDRAQERRELANEYERIAAEFENHGEVSVEESKYLGGDLEHTHLVKGLDYALLTKVRTELTKQKKAEEIQQIRLQKRGQKQRGFQTELGKKVWRTVVDTLHPHHSTFKQRVEKMSQAIAAGQRIRGAPHVFLPGRMCFEFDTGVAQTKTDIPRIVYISKEDGGKAGDSLAANQKQEAKKRKMTEHQEWQKIDHMIKKGKHGSLEELEAFASRPKRNQPPVPREIMSTPVYF